MYYYALWDFVFSFGSRFCCRPSLILLWLYLLCLKTWCSCCSFSRDFPHHTACKPARLVWLGLHFFELGVLKLGVEVHILMCRFPMWCVPNWAIHPFIRLPGHLETARLHSSLSPQWICFSFFFLWVPFRCFRNSCNISFPCSYMTKVLSMFLYQWVSLFISVLMFLFEVFHVEVCKHLSITDFFAGGWCVGWGLQACINTCVYLVIILVGLIVNVMIFTLLLFLYFCDTLFCFPTTIILRHLSFSFMHSLVKWWIDVSLEIFALNELVSTVTCSSRRQTGISTEKPQFD